MLQFVVPTAVAGIHFVAAVACLCSATDGTVVAAAVLVLPDIYFSLVVGAATAAVVVGVVSTVAASDAGAASVVVSVVAGAVAAGVATWVLSADVISTPLVCPVQTFPSPSVLSLSTLVQILFHSATFCAARACMHLRTCGRHPVCHSGGGFVFGTMGGNCTHYGLRRIHRRSSIVLSCATLGRLRMPFWCC